MSSGTTGPTGGTYSQKDIDEGKPLSAVGYLVLCCLPLFLIPMLAAKENAYAQYHARQGAVLYIVAIVGGIASMAFNFATQMIGHGASCLGSIVSLGWSGAVLVVMVLGIINALQGQAKELPIIGQYASMLPF